MGVLDPGPTTHARNRSRRQRTPETTVPREAETRGGEKSNQRRIPTGSSLTSYGHRGIGHSGAITTVTGDRPQVYNRAR